MSSPPGGPDPARPGGARSDGPPPDRQAPDREAPEREGPVRGKRPTMADVAARVGVSRQLVSLVLAGRPGPNAGTRDRILRAAEDLDYHADTAARLLRRARTRQLGVLFTMEHSLDPHLVEALYPAAARLDYSIVLSAMLPSRGVREAIDELLGLRCEALILIGLSAEAPAHLATVSQQVPVVEIGQRTGAAGADSVRTSDSEGIRLAVDHLVELGHREIVHVDGGELPGAAERRQAYLREMRARGLGAHLRVLPGDYTEESGARAARTLLAEPTLPTAVVAGNDLCACGLLETLVRSGVHAPEDLSVVGYDDSRTARLSFLSLTSVRQDATAMAERAVRAAAERLDDGRTDTEAIVLAPTLAVRSSTGPPPDAAAPGGDGHGDHGGRDHGGRDHGGRDHESKSHGNGDHER
ncbi:LacI family DNA-binding transcriptional regulator [Saccharopolyspora cebuensis]|uniref:LacI family DNA-binding transcriptional regulator n=1 Tax=Saccharopolyspora cebuensis TaxID=418759 RepID=A0ABV4CDV9_9PSEU